MALTLTPLSFTGKVGQALSVTFTAGGGVAPYTYSSLDAPTDLTFTDNVLGGTPSTGFYTLSGGVPVADTFTVTVTDSDEPVVTADFTVSALITATNLTAIPAWKNIASYEQDIPTDSGATVIIPQGKYVVGSYYTFLSLSPDKWEYLADSSSLTSSQIKYVNTPNLTGNLMTVPIPSHSAASGYKGQIAIDDTILYANIGNGVWKRGTLTTFTDNSSPIPEINIFQNRKPYEVDYMTSDGYFCRIPTKKSVLWAGEAYIPDGETDRITVIRFPSSDWEHLSDTEANRATGQFTDYGFFGYHRLVGIPLTTTSAGYPGNIAYDRSNSKIYLCTAANTWRVATLTTF